MSVPMTLSKAAIFTEPFWNDLNDMLDMQRFNIFIVKLLNDVRILSVLTS